MKRLSVLLLLSVLGLVGCQTQKESLASKATEEARIDVRIRWAKQHIQNAEYEEAKRPLTQAVEINPKNPKVLNLLAFVFQQQGEMELADSYYQQMLKAEPDFAAGHNNYGIFLMLQKRYPEACTHLHLASANPLYEGRPQALENLASCYLLDGQQAKAEETYRQVLRLSPSSAITLVELANLVYARGDSGEAWSLFGRFSDMVNQRVAEHSAKSLWLGLRLAREGRDVGMATTYALLLKNLFPSSPEYQLYKESRQ